MHRALTFIAHAETTPLEAAAALWRKTTATFIVARPPLLEDGAWLAAALRGAWGRALKPLSNEAFEVFFTTLAQTHAGRALPKPFNISFENKNNKIEICLTLFGIAEAWREVAFEAFLNALNAGISLRATGLPMRRPFTVLSYDWQRTESVDYPLMTDGHRLLFKTPVRFGHKNRLQAVEIAFIPTLLSRVLSLAPWMGMAIEIDQNLWQILHERLVINSNALYPHAWRRFSGAQNRRAIPMMGMLGSLDIKRTPEPLVQLLALAQTAFIGQHTTLGLGRFELL
jgi:CRISPR-associated endoribonuclease Cas6